MWYRYAVSIHRPGVVTRLTKLGFSHSITMDKVGWLLVLVGLLTWWTYFIVWYSLLTLWCYVLIDRITWLDCPVSIPICISIQIYIILPGYFFLLHCSIIHYSIYFCLLIVFNFYCMCIVHLPVLLCCLVLWPQDWINTTTTDSK